MTTRFAITRAMCLPGTLGIILISAIPSFATVWVCSPEMALLAASAVSDRLSEPEPADTTLNPALALNAPISPIPAVQPVSPKPHFVELSALNWHPLSRSDKFEFFWRDLIMPETHLSLAIDAAISWGTDDLDYMGEGARGFARRYGFNLADEANWMFVQSFLLPTIFHEDPRYIPLERGSKAVRVAYALSRVIVTRRDTGEFGFNKSKMLGTFISATAANFYYPREFDTSVSATITRGFLSLGSDAAFNIFKEFWPDFARRFKVNLWIQNVVRSMIRDETRVF